MRNIRLAFILLMALALTSKIGYSALYFEMNVYGYGNMTFGLPSSNNTSFAFDGAQYNGVPLEPRHYDAIVSGGFSWEGGFLSQLGIFIDYPSEFSGISIMAEVGTQLENMEYTSSIVEYKNASVVNANCKVSTSFWTVNLGAGAKAHFFENIAIGVFLGVKFIVSPETVSRVSSDLSIDENFSRATPAIAYPYAKISAEYSIVINNNLAIPIGVFFGFDGAQYLTDDVENRIFSVDIGLMVGLRYRYRASR